MRRWITLTARDFFWLAIVIGLVVGWRLHHENFSAIMSETTQGQDVLSKEFNDVHSAQKAEIEKLKSQFASTERHFFEETDKLRREVRDLKTQLREFEQREASK